MTNFQTLWHWRRTVSDLYAEIRRHADAHAAHALWRSRRRTLFVDHDQSPLDPAARGPYRGPHTYPYDPALRVAVWLDPADDQTIELECGADGVVPATAFATTIGLVPQFGAELTLYWLNLYGGGVFLPFRDLTNGRETYGGGRYLLDTIKGADLGHDAEDRCILDFNFSYYPSCAYSTEYVCPLPPRDNMLAVAVRGGERESPWADETG